MTASSITRTVHTALVGESHPVSVETFLSQIDSLSALVGNSEDLTFSQEAQLRDVLKTRLTAELNDEFRSQILFNGSPKEQLTVHRYITTITQDGGEVGAPFIYERDYGKSEDWQPRIQMIEKALNTRQIFSFSIKPIDPSEIQTWYMKKHNPPLPAQPTDEEVTELFGLTPDELIQPSMPISPEFEPMIQSQVEILMQSLGPIPEGARAQIEAYLTREVKSMCRETQLEQKSSSEPDSIESPAPRFTGFFAPFTAFSSSLAKPQYNLDILPAHVQTANIWNEREVKPILDSLENSESRERVEAILVSFRDDIHAEGLGLTILEPSREHKVKTLFFKKVF